MTEDTKSEFPRKVGSGSGDETAYSVQARWHSTSNPRKIADIEILHTWAGVAFPRSRPEFGVPLGHFHYADKINLMSWAAANALRWWLHAIAEGTGAHFALETRIVRHNVTWAYTDTIDSAHHVIGMEDRSAAMPDWGKKEEEE